MTERLIRDVTLVDPELVMGDEARVVDPEIEGDNLLIQQAVERTLSSWELAFRRWQDDGGVNYGDFPLNQMRQLAYKRAGLGKRVLNGAISTANAEDRERAMRTENTGQSDYPEELKRTV